jgi:hypothetical protein
LFQPPASLKNATNEHLSGRRPTDLFFFVLFVSFVVQAFFQPPASLKNAKNAKKTTNEHLPGRRPTNPVFLRALRVLRGSIFSLKQSFSGSKTSI